MSAIPPSAFCWAARKDAAPLTVSALSGEIVPTLATLLGTHPERLVGIVDQLARRAHVPELGALLTR